MEFTGACYADAPPVEVEIEIAAPPERVWELVEDVQLMPEMSPELQRVEWLDGATAPAVGTRWIGHTVHPALGGWQATSQVVECRAPEVLAWHVHMGDEPAARWRLTLEPTAGGGTLLREWVQVGPGPSGLTIVIGRMPEQEAQIVHSRLNQLETNMTTTLAAIKERAES